MASKARRSSLGDAPKSLSPEAVGKTPEVEQKPAAEPKPKEATKPTTKPKTKENRSQTMPVNQNQKPEPKLNSHFRVLVIGSQGSGKGSLIHRFSTSKFFEAGGSEAKKDNAKKTIPLGAKPKKNQQQQQKTADVEVATTNGGLESKLLDTFIRMSNGFILTFALDDPKSLEEARQYHSHVQIVKGVGKKLHCVLVGTKSDLKSKAITEQQIQSVARELGNLPFIEISSKTGNNVDKVFLALITSLDAEENHKQPTSSATPPTNSNASNKKPNWLALHFGGASKQQQNQQKISLPSSSSSSNSEESTSTSSSTPKPTVVVKVNPALFGADLIEIVDV